MTFESTLMQSRMTQAIYDRVDSIMMEWCNESNTKGHMSLEDWVTM